MDGVDCENVVEAGEDYPSDDPADVVDLDDHQLVSVAIDRYHAPLTSLRILFYIMAVI